MATIQAAGGKVAARRPAKPNSLPFRGQLGLRGPAFQEFKLSV